MSIKTLLFGRARSSAERAEQRELARQASQLFREGRRAARARYCTKHAIQKPMIPGGPERMVWVNGTHRTPGNGCDGPEHRRVTSWW